MKLNLIVAACGSELGIGKNGTLPWRLREELKHFSRLTMGDGPGRNAVIMGRKTWISIPENMRPLKNRLNVILSRQTDYDPKSEVTGTGNKDDVILCKSLEDAVKLLSNNVDANEIAWIIGGSQVYEYALQSDLLHRVYMTEILTPFDCDTFFPKFDPAEFRVVVDEKVSTEEQREGDVQYRFKVFEKN